MKSAWFFLPVSGKLREGIEKAERILLDEFGGFTQGHSEGIWKDPGTGQVVRDRVSTYEVAIPEARLRTIPRIAKEIATALRESALYLRLGDKQMLVQTGRERPAQEALAVQDIATTGVKTTADPWPKRFDIALQAVLSAELKSIQRFFSINPTKDVTSIDGSHYYRGKDATGHSVVVYIQGHAGNDAAALAAERLINKWKPRVLFLVGIAAGRRGKCKIGDVVIPRAIVDDTLGVAQARKRLKRTKISTPPHVMVQQFLNYQLNFKRWHARLFHAMRAPRAPRGRAKQFKSLVARWPSCHESAIYSSNLLLRDPTSYISMLMRHMNRSRSAKWKLPALVTPAKKERAPFRGSLFAACLTSATSSRTIASTPGPPTPRQAISPSSSTMVCA